MSKEKQINEFPDGGIAIGFDSDMVKLRIDQIVPIKVVANTL